MISRGPGPTSETSLFHIPVWNVVSVSLFAIILLSFFAVVNRHPLQIIRLFFIDCSEICFINRAGKIFSLLAAQGARPVSNNFICTPLRNQVGAGTALLSCSYRIILLSASILSFTAPRYEPPLSQYPLCYLHCDPLPSVSRQE